MALFNNLIYFSNNDTCNLMNNEPGVLNCDTSLGLLSYNTLIIN